MKGIFRLLFCVVCIVSCSTDAVEEETDVNNGVGDNPTENPAPNAQALYFPPLSSSEWEQTTPEELGWNTAFENELFDFLGEKNTKAFLILKNGRIVVEWYFDDHTQDSNWFWASAGKTLTAFMVGVAQEENFLSIDAPSSDYLGVGWTSTPREKEDLITVWHQLTMTSGMNDFRFDCVTSDCLTFVADAGTRWAYHNGPYTLLQTVVANASQNEWTDYFNEKLRNRIGMDGFWFSTNGLNNVYFSTARSMARFGLLNLNSGVWDGEVILSDMDFLSEMKNSSQNINEAYGYLWWLNGKDSFRVPASQQQFDGALIPNAPTDLFSGLGRDDQKLYIIPSQDLVVIRMGESAEEELLGPSSFDNTLWGYLVDFMN